MLFTNSKRQANEKRGHIIVAVNKTLNFFSDGTKTRDLQGAIGICNQRASIASCTSCPLYEVVRAKSNLKIGHENYLKTVRFFLIGT